MVNVNRYYLCIVMDLFSRKVISWHMSTKPDVTLIITALKKTYNRRNAPFGLMFHSDRGSQYTAFSFRQLLDSHNIVQSFSKKGYPFDTLIANVSSSFSRKKKPTEEHITLCRNCNFLCLNISKDSTPQKGHMVLLE